MNVERSAWRVPRLRAVGVAHPPLLLAPMAGYTNAPTRRIAHRFGAAWSYTEMAHATGLIHASDRTWQLLETFADEGPVVAHLYGTDPAAFAEAARRIAASGRFMGIDINAGCPAPKITRSGAGATLLRAPAHVGRIVAAIRAVCDLPVTVKTRLGLHPGHLACFDLLQAVQDHGAAALAIHGRYASQGHAGPVDLAQVAALRERASIPIIGNGGIRDVAAARRFLDATGVGALMLGQGAIGNPWIFQELAAGLTESPAEAPCPQRSLDERRAAIHEHLAAEVEFQERLARKYPHARDKLTPEYAAVIGFRVHFFNYLRGLRGVAQARGQLNALQTLGQVYALVDTCLAREAEFRARRRQVTKVETG
ncbi:MAG: tRNA-dihydrouridine synthase [Lentisphaerae bacterium]|nr:tRNA-dihydrouridine synthase [Lentisphaerota bacterium]